MSGTRQTGTLGGFRPRPDGPAAALAGTTTEADPPPGMVPLDSGGGPGVNIDVFVPDGADPSLPGGGSGGVEETPQPLLGDGEEQGTDFAPDLEPPPVEPAEPPRRIRMQPGPLGGVGVPDDIEPAGGTLELLRSLRRLRPSPMAPPRPQDFVDRGPRNQVILRESTIEEQEELLNLLDRRQRGGGSMRMLSLQGDYVPQDLQQFVGAVRDANQTLFDELRRGRMSRDEMISLAGRIGLDGTVDQLLRRRPGEALNAEGLVAGVVALVNVQRETQRAAAALLSTGTPTPQQLRAFGLNLALQQALAGQLNGATAEAGRALGALRFATDALHASPPDELGALAQRLGRLGQAGPEGLRVPLDAGDAAVVDLLGGEDVLRAAAVAYNALPTAAQRAQFAQRTIGQRGGDAFVAAWVNSLLWLPSTHMKNMLGNTVMGLWQVPERFLAGAVGAARQATGLGADERVYMGEGLAMLYSLHNTLGDAFRASGQVWRTGIPQGGSGKIDMPRANPISAEILGASGTWGRAIDLLGVGVTIPGRTLITADAFFQTMAYRAELHAQALRHRNQLVQQGMSLTDAAEAAARYYETPPAAWRDAAEGFARSVVFQQEMQGTLRQLAEVMRHPVAKVYVPFFSTPTNIVRAVLHRTPAGLITPGVWADITAGGARFDLAVSRLSLGTAAVYLMYSVVADSAMTPDFRITGGAPSEPARRQAWQRQGMQAYSICNRTDAGWSCNSYRALDPVSGLLAMAADAHNYVMDHPNTETDNPAFYDDLGNIFAGAAIGLYEFTLESPFLTGVSDLHRTIGGAHQSGETRALAAARQIAAQAGTAAIGATPLPLTGGPFSGALERAINPVQQETRLEGREWMASNPATRGFAEALARAQARSPITSGNRLPVLNIWGEQVQPTEGGAWELFWPFRHTTGRDDALEQALFRLGGVLPLPRRYFPGTTVELTPAQYTRLIRDMNSAELGGGSTMREDMLAAVTSPGFDLLAPAEQMAQLRGIRELRWRMAMDISLEADADLARRVERDRQVRAVTGRSPAQGAFND